MKKTMRNALTALMLAAAMIIGLFPSGKAYAAAALNVHITNIYYINRTVPASSVNGKAVAWEKVFAISSGGTKTVAHKGTYSYVGGENAKASADGFSTQFLNAFVEAPADGSPVFADSLDGLKTIQKISYKNGTATMTFTDGDTKVFPETADVYISPVYSMTLHWHLNYRYIDNYSTGSGSWANIGAASSFTHTFQQPEAQEHVQFLYWENDETKQQFNDGDADTWTAAQFQQGETRNVTIHAWWQPSVTVNYCAADGTLLQSAESFEAINVYETLTPEDVTTEDGITEHFTGWYDAEGTRVEGGTIYAAPAPTAEKQDRLVYDLTARYETERSITLTWDDNDNQDGIRPETVTVILTADDEASQEAELNEENNWTASFENLPVGTAARIVYGAAQQELPESYEASLETEGGNFHFTNTHKPAVADITITNSWDDEDDKDGLRPETVKVTVYANGEAVLEAELTAENDWTATLPELPVNANGEEIVYTISQEAVEGYETAIEGFEITNRHEPAPEPVIEIKSVTEPEAPIETEVEPETEPETEAEVVTEAAPETEVAPETEAETETEAAAEVIENNDTPLATPEAPAEVIAEEPVPQAAPAATNGRLTMDRGYEQILDDQVPQALPVTGQVNWPILMLSLCGCLFLAAAAMTRRVKEEA